MDSDIWNEARLEDLYCLVKETNLQVKEMNGSIQRHNEEIFGGNNSPGIKQEVTEFHDFMVSTKSSVRTIVTLVSVVGIANLIALTLLITKAAGHV